MDSEWIRCLCQIQQARRREQLADMFQRVAQIACFVYHIRGNHQIKAVRDKVLVFWGLFQIEETIFYTWIGLISLPGLQEEGMRDISKHIRCTLKRKQWQQVRSSFTCTSTNFENAQHMVWRKLLEQVLYIVLNLTIGEARDWIVRIKLL